MRRALLLLSLATGLLVVTPVDANACSCPVPGPPCDEVWKAALVFSGKVTAIVPLRAPGAGLPPDWGPRRVRFAISEAFRGTDAREVELYSQGGGSAACDYSFRVGEEYLVYARPRSDGVGWITSTCSRTRALRHAAEDLGYLRLPDNRKPPGHIEGRVSRHVYDLSQRKPGENVAVPGVPVIVTGGRTRLQSKTDGEGRYSVPAEPGYAYQVRFGPVEGLSIRASQQVSLSHPRACAVVNASALYDGRLEGRVVDDSGRPVSFLPITLVSSPRLLMQHTMTDLAGWFQFREVYPAAHIVVPSTSLWEGARALPPLTPAPITVAPAARVDAGSLRVPSSVKLTLVEILIEDSAGNPASGAHVTFKQVDDYEAISYAPPADNSGAFRVSVIAGQRYEVSAGYARKTPTGAVYETGQAVIDATGMKPIRLRLARER